MVAHTVPWAQRPESRLLLVLSSERSGSTLMRYTLGRHSRLVSPSELFLMRFPEYDAWRTHKAVAMHSLLEFFALVGQPKSAEELDSMLATLETAEVYRRLFGFMPDGAILVDKTPAYGNELSTLERSRPLAPFYLRIIRHPLGVIDSHLRIKDKEKRQRAEEGSLPRRLLAPLTGAIRRLNGSREALARRREAKWVQQHRNFRQFLETVPADQQLTIYFEDLVQQPAPTIAAVCRAMGLAEEPGLLDFSGTRPEMNPHLGDPNFHTHTTIDSAPAFEWAARMSESWLMPQTLQLMKELRVRFLPASATLTARA